jgi:divalent metal cation (Fe/Co/Zn/Cd) transporter
LKTGIEIMRDSAYDLMDTVPGRSLAKRIVELLSDIPEVKQVEEVHAHRFGPYLVVNITIGVDGSLSVAEGDKVSSRVERTLYDNIDFMRRVHVHYHPVSGRQSPSIICRGV